MIKTLEELKEAISDYIYSDLNEEAFIDWYNNYVEEVIHYMADFDDCLCEVSASGIIEMCSNYCISTDDDYFRYDYGEGIATGTSCEPRDLVDPEELTDYILDNLDNDWDDEIRKMIDEYNKNDKRNAEIEDIKRQLAILQQRLEELEKEEEE